MYQFTKDISQIYSRTRPTDIKPIMDTFKAFNPDYVEQWPLKYIEFTGLPKAVWRFFEAKTGKTGKEAVKKLFVQLKVGSIKSINNIKCRTVHDLILQSCFDIVRNAIGDQTCFMVFNFGFVATIKGWTIGYIKEAIGALPLPVGIKVGDI
jgi:hypothetical protein